MLPLRTQSAGAPSGLKRKLGGFLCTFRHDTTDVYFFNYDRPLEVILFCFVLLDAFATKRSDLRMFFFSPYFVRRHHLRKNMQRHPDLGHFPSCTTFFLLYIISFASCTTYSLVHHLHSTFLLLCTQSFPIYPYPPSSILIIDTLCSTSTSSSLSHPPCPSVPPGAILDTDTETDCPDLDESWAILRLLFNSYYFISWTPYRVDPVISIRPTGLLPFCSLSLVFSLSLCRALATTIDDTIPPHRASSVDLFGVNFEFPPTTTTGVVISYILYRVRITFFLLVTLFS